ncbi:MAG: hypothetical protein JWN70_911 [Planctomycetaceae bacterium]|nr:hypothetical protein [Planctomycetaceae bacterium]
MNKIDELVKLSSLLNSKAIDIHEFEKLKAEVMNQADDSPATVQSVTDITGGAASKMVSLEWAKFIVGLILILIIGSIILSQVFRDSPPFDNGPKVPPGFHRGP